MVKRDFDAWLSKFRASISGYRYYIDFDKVVRNVEDIKIELNILNSLIGSVNIEDDFEKIIKWENEYLKDMQNKLRQEHRFVDDCYSLDIYEDLKKLLGYKKYLDSYKEIETEDEMKYALLFGLKECPYPMYSCFVMQSIEADHGVSRGSGLY